MVTAAYCVEASELPQGSAAIWLRSASRRHTPSTEIGAPSERPCLRTPNNPAIGRTTSTAYAIRKFLLVRDMYQSPPKRGRGLHQSSAISKLSLWDLHHRTVVAGPTNFQAAASAK